jgi:hypothetical protein
MQARVVLSRSVIPEISRKVSGSSVIPTGADKSYPVSRIVWALLQLKEAIIKKELNIRITDNKIFRMGKYLTGLIFSIRIMQ